MPLRYLDTTYNYSDPANTNLKYLKKVVDPDGTIRSEWAAPTDDAEFYDATGGWSVPELGPDLSGLTNWDDISWDVINEFGQKRVLKNPGRYGGLVHTTKTIPAVPGIEETVYKIVDTCHSDWGDDIAFVWMPKENCLTTMDHQQSAETYQSYKTSQIKYSLMSGWLFSTYPDDLKAVWKDIHYKYLTYTSTVSSNSTAWKASGDVTTETAKLVIPSISEMGLTDYVGNENYNKEGTVFQAFSSNTPALRIRKNNNGEAAYWWLRSLSVWYGSFTYFAYIYTNGSAAQTSGQPSAYQKRWVCPCFAV